MERLIVVPVEDLPRGVPLESPESDPGSSPGPRLRPLRLLRDAEIEEMVNYGSEGDSEFGDEYNDLERGPILISRVMQAEMETPVDHDDAEIAHPVVVEVDPPIAPDRLTGATQPSDFFEFEWRRFPDPPIPQTERREAFTQAFVGPTEPSQDPYTIFSTIWDSQIMEKIVLETNKYAQNVLSQQLRDNTLRSRSRIVYWKDTCIDELYTFFAIILAMGIVVKSRIEEFWTTDSTIFATPGFRSQMSLERFQLLSSCLHFNDNRGMRGSNLSPAEAKLFKIEPIIKHLNEKFQAMYTMDQNISLDESLVQWKGWLNIEQFISNKAAKNGVKSYELYESETGYLWRFTIHALKHVSQDPENPLGVATPTIVLDLLRGLEGKGYTVWMNNFYNSPALARKLKTMGFDVAGTLRTNQKFVPQELDSLTESNMRKGQITGFTSGDVDILVWLHENRVATISTYHGIETGDLDGEMKPCVILDYNVMMGGVDKKNQLLSMYPVEGKHTKVWYKILFRRLLNITTLNSYIIAKKSGSSLEQHSFRKALIQTLFSRHNRSSNPSVVLPRLPVYDARTHYIDEHPLSPSNTQIHHRCNVCKKRTYFFCAGCVKSVCLKPCFVALHR